MAKISDEELLTAAKEAQYLVILKWLRSNYADGTSQIESYSEFLYGLSGFSATRVKINLHKDVVRRRLKKLAKEGEIGMRLGRRKGSSVQFFFGREVCDELAAKATKHWESLGLSLYERRYLNGGNQK